MAAEPLPFIDLAAQRAALGSLDEAVARVLAHGQYVLGPEVTELEGQLAERAEVRHAITCASGTDALVLVLMAMGVGPGDAVLVPSFTFAATAGAVAICGATPVFLDVLDDSANLDAEQLAPAVRRAQAAGLRPAGVIPVDLYGQPADYDEIVKEAEAAGLWVLADAAQSFGATYRGVAVGALVPVTTTSFFPSKPLGAYGDGGAVFTDDDELADVLVSLREHGRGDHRYDIVRIGINGRLDTLQAAVLLEKLTIFDAELAARNEVAARYDALLGDAVRTPSVAVARTSTWAQYTVRVPDRDAVAAALAAEGVPTAVHYPVPLHRQPAYATAGLIAGDLPVAERLSTEVLSLPMHPYLDPADQERIGGAVGRAVGS